MKKPDMGKREEQFMAMAVDLSREGMDQGKGGPFGAVVIRGNEVIGKGFNSVLSLHDPTAHAEIVAIRDACRTLGQYQLDGCEIYTSCEPCPMCLGAIYWARPDKVYYANTREDAARIGFDDAFIYQEMALPEALRKIPVLRLEDPEAREVFARWTEKENKRTY